VSPPTYDATESSHGASFKNCLVYAPEIKGFPEGLIISGGQDSIIEARQPDTTSEQDADGLMIGHTNQVCSLDVNVEAGYVVSGSWDKTAKVWQLGRWEPEVELQGHDGSVWAVIAYSGDTIVTGKGIGQILTDFIDIVQDVPIMESGSLT
jgi:phospholipase A-2-activating protein